MQEYKYLLHLISLTVIINTKVQQIQINKMSRYIFILLIQELDQFKEDNKINSMQQDQPSHPKTADSCQKRADLGSLSIHWVFLLNFKPSQDQLTRINTYFHTPQGWEDNLGRNFNDFMGIIDRITLHANQTKIFQLKLALDLHNYKAIFKDQKNREKVKFLSRISKIYLFSFDNDAGEIKKIKQENKLIDLQASNFNDFLDQHYKEIMNQEINKKLLPNFNILGFQKSQRFSDERRLKIYAFMKLPISEYPKYLQKFRKAVQRSKYLIDSRNDQTVSQLSSAIISLANDHKKAFYCRMLALYQKQSIFYHILNLYLKKCADPKFSWDQMALPICLMFKAIKFYFHDVDNRQEIDKLFDSNGVCVLWRGAKYGISQLNEMINSQKQQHVYYQQVSFTSTSIYREVAQRFIKKDKNQHKEYCLFKFILHRPNFEAQIEKLDFTYLSFALLLNRKEYQVLLNPLTICKLRSINKTSIDIVNKICDGHTKREKQYLGKVEIPLIQMEIIGNLIKPYFRKSQLENANLSNAQIERIELPKYIISYLTIIDIIKNHKVFDIPLALQYSGHFEEAYSYFQQLLRAEQANSNRNIRRIYDLQSRIATLLQRMQRNQQALQMIDNALETCKQIREKVKNMALKDHLALTYKMIEKSSYILQENDYYVQSIYRITQQLQILKFKYDHADRQVKQQRSQLGIIYYVRDVNSGQQDEKIKKKLYRFHSAQYLLLRGMVKFKQGHIREARQDVVESRRIVSEVLESIGYEDLKTETFYIEFILHFIFNENVKWDTEYYFKKKRIQNIASATAIFGGQHRIVQLKASSTDFEQQMTKFIKGYEESIIQSNSNLVENQPAQEKIDMRDLVQTIERQLIVGRDQSTNSKLKINCELQNKVRQFFTYFKQILNEKENPTKKAIDKFQQQFQKILIEDIPRDQMISSIMTSQARLLYYRDEIINCVLRDWELTYVKEETRFQIQKKMDQLIFLKKKLNRKKVQCHVDSITPQQFKSYCASNIKQIKSFITRSEIESHSFPSAIKDRAYHQLAKHYQNIGNQQKALEIIHHVITTSTLIDQRKKFKILNLVETYLLKIGIIFNEAEIDFQHALLYRAVQKFAQIRKYQKDLIGKCKRNLDDIKLIIKQYETKYQQQTNNKLKDNKIKKGLAKKNIEIKLWDMRIRIYQIFFARQSVTASKKVNLQKIATIQAQIKSNIKIATIQAQIESDLKIAAIQAQIKSDLKIATIQAQIKSGLNQNEKVQYEAEYHQASSFLHYILHRFDFSFSNLKEALKKMRISNSHKKMKVFTKLFFWFSPVQRQKLQDEQGQLKRLYRQYAASPSYWRICLAYHFYFRRARPSSFPLTQCLKQIKQISAYKYHHSIIQTCEQTMYKSFLSQIGVEDHEHQDQAQAADCPLNPQSILFENFDKLLQESQQFMRSKKEIVLPEPIEINQIYIGLKNQRQHKKAFNPPKSQSFMMSTRSSILKKH